MKKETPLLSFDPRFLNDARIEHLVCAFSGGADSLALVLAVAEDPRLKNYVKHAVYVHHHLRAEADDELTFCARMAEEQHFSFHALHVYVAAEKRPGEGIESAARRCRYAALTNLILQLTAGEVSSAALLLGHHRDDQLETFFIRMMRGSNLSGLLAPRAYSVHEAGYGMLRPLLQTSRVQILDFLAQHGVTEFVHDASNENPDYCARNHVRHAIIAPLCDRFAHAQRGFYSSLDALNDDAAFIEEAAHAAFARLRCGETILEAKGFLDLHDALKIRVLRYFLHACGFNSIPNTALLARLNAALREPVQKRRKIPVDAHCVLCVNGALLSVEKR